MKRLHTFALALMLTGAAGATLGADIIEQILVRVNGEIITKSDLEQRQIAALRQRPEVQGLRGDDEKLAQLLSEVTPAVIVDAVAPKPVNVLVGRAAPYTLADLARLGVRRVSVGGALAGAAWGGFLNAARELAAGRFDGFAGNATHDEMDALMR